MAIIYSIYEKESFSPKLNEILAKMLIKQQKILGDPYKKMNKCQIICVAYENNIPIAVGAIKNKTNSDFLPEKGNLPSLSRLFSYELGYIFVDEQHRHTGVAKMIVKFLLAKFGEGNLMATTEYLNNPSMVSILEKNDFKRSGNDWKSQVSNKLLGLYLRQEH
jgi:hypothetical protein